MANIKSKIKRIGTNRKAEERNKAVRTEVKSAVRAAREAANSGDKKAAEAALQNATRKLDKAVSKGVVVALVSSSYFENTDFSDFSRDGWITLA